MISRERVLAVLNGKIPDRVPWIESYVSNEVIAGLLGHDKFIKNTYSYRIDFPGMIRVLVPRGMKHIGTTNASTSYWLKLVLNWIKLKEVRCMWKCSELSEMKADL